MSAARNRHERRAANRGTPPDAVIERLCELAETSGCERCGARFAELAPYFICETPSGALSVRCPDCHDIDAVSVFGCICVPGGGEPWAANDREWFAANPTRRLRLREPWRGEVETLARDEDAVDIIAAFKAQAAQHGMQLAIAVLQIEPGRRIREICAIPSPDPLDSFTDAGIRKLLPGLRANTVAELPAAEIDRWHTQTLEARGAATLALIREVLA